MPTTKEITLYTFDELSDEAKEKARNWYRADGLGYEWWESTYDAVDKAASLLGIEIERKGKNKPAIYFSGFCSQGDGAHFIGSWRYKKGWRKAVCAEFGGDWQAELIELGLALQWAACPEFYQVNARCSHSGHYMHSGMMDIHVDHDERWDLRCDSTEDAVQSALRGFADWIYAKLEAEDEYLNADEQVDESIRINDYTFLEDGTRE